MCTVDGTSSWTHESQVWHMNVKLKYLCHFSTEMAEIWSPGTSLDVWTNKISAPYHLYFWSYKAFSGVFLLFLLKALNSESTSDR